MTALAERCVRGVHPIDAGAGRHAMHDDRSLRSAGRRATRAIVATLAMLLCLFAGIAAAQDAPQAGDDFLKLVDAKQYGESWDAASDYLKQSVSRAEWATQMVKARETIGDVASRKRVRAEPQTNPPGAPSGEYMLVTYETVFASQGAPKTETLPLVKGADGRWRAVGYFVR